MQAKTIAIIIKIVELISNILVSRNHYKGGKSNDKSGSSKEK